ncbi:hypothetical protein PS2_033856 [Malus domestica]
MTQYNHNVVMHLGGTNKWIINTEANDHVTSDPRVFDELCDYVRDPYITSANGAHSLVKGEGIISLTPTLSLVRALLVPDVKYNLLSVGKLLDALYCFAYFYLTYCYFQDNQTQKLIDHGKRIMGLYILTMDDTVVSGSNNHQVLSAKVDDRHQIWLWHRRLGHPSFSYMKHLFPSLFRTCRDSEFKCETCVMAKSYRASFPNKSDVLLLLQEFCTMVSTQFQTKVKTTTPFTPQQNDVSKRKNRQIMEVARSLMLDKCVPNHLWGHVVLAAVYLINRVPSMVLDFQTPFNVLQKHVSLVSVSKLPPKVFGCIAYVHVYSHQRSKLNACALRFIGYANNKKGYKCYHHLTQKTYITMDVTFHEEVSCFVKPSSDYPLQGERGSEVQIRRDGMDDVLHAELGTEPYVA